MFAKDKATSVWAKATTNVVKVLDTKNIENNEDTLKVDVELDSEDTIKVYFQEKKDVVKAKCQPTNVGPKKKTVSNMNKKRNGDSFLVLVDW